VVDTNWAGSKREIGMSAQHRGSGQLDDRKPRLSEDDIQRQQFGPRGVPGQPDPAKMTPQRDKKTPKNVDPGHTA
jgi:hypothetical protein